MSSGFEIDGGEGNSALSDDLSGDESFRSNLAFSFAGNNFVHKGVGGQFSMVVIVVIAILYFILRKK